jgi:cell division protein ZapA
MKQIEVQIMGQSYILACSEEGESTLRQAVAKVDTAMCQIRDAGKIKARDRIAVLAALNIAAQSLTTEKINLPETTFPSPMNSDELSRLMAKLDHVLAEDGQLL